MSEEKKIKLIFIAMYQTVMFISNVNFASTCAKRKKCFSTFCVLTWSIHHNPIQRIWMRTVGVKKCNRFLNANIIFYVNYIRVKDLRRLHALLLIIVLILRVLYQFIHKKLHKYEGKKALLLVSAIVLSLTIFREYRYSKTYSASTKSSVIYRQ